MSELQIPAEVISTKSHPNSFLLVCLLPLAYSSSLKISVHQDSATICRESDKDATSGINLNSYQGQSRDQEIYIIFTKIRILCLKNPVL